MAADAQGGLGGAWPHRLGSTSLAALHRHSVRGPPTMEQPACRPWPLLRVTSRGAKVNAGIAL